MLAPPIDVKPSSVLYRLSQKVLGECDNDMHKAIASLKKQLIRDKRLMHEVVDAIVHLAIKEAVSHAVRSKRRSLLDAAEERVRAATEEANANRSERAEKRVAALTESLLNFMLPNSKKSLGEATRSDLALAMGYYSTMGHDSMHKVRWLAAIKRLLTDDVTAVKKAVPPDRIDQLWQETKNA